MPAANSSDTAPGQPQALVVLVVHPDMPFCLYEDTAPDFALACFDYSGKNHAPKTRYAIDHPWSAAVEGKGAVLNTLSGFPEFSDSAFDYFAVIDHDVLLSISDINRLLFIGRFHALDVFQPSLSRDSFISHPHTAHREGFLLRETSFVESMCPFFSARAFNLAKDLFPECISAYGLDLAWSSRVRKTGGRLAIVDAVLARHTRPVTSHTRNFSNGRTPRQELQRTVEHHGLQDYRIE